MRKGSRNLDLNKLMANVGNPQFDFGTFKSAYDTDQRVKAMVKNFDKVGIEPNTMQDMEAGGGVGASDAPAADPVSQMAKSATDLGDKL